MCIVIKTNIVYTMKTGQIIEGLRKKFGWTQVDLARRTKISQVMIGKYEREEAAPSIDAANRIAKTFDVSLGFLVGEKTVNPGDFTLKLLNEVNELPREAKEQIFNVIQALVKDYKSKIKLFEEV